MAEPAALPLDPWTIVGGVTPQRAYATAAVKVRLHQRRFRELVVSAYQVMCAMCRLRHGERAPRGLCKIHHAAYDANIVGVDPEYRVHVRRDVLEEHDGPMLQHGLQAMQDVRIRLPQSEGQRPRGEYLEERYAWLFGLPPSGFPDDLGTGNLDRVRQLVGDVSLGLDLDGPVDQGLELGVVTAKRERRPYLFIRPKGLGCSNGRCEIGVPSHKDGEVAGVEREELEQLRGHRHVGFLLLMPFVELLALRALSVLFLEPTHLDLNAGRA